jgi:hypothetical protein
MSNDISQTRPEPEDWVTLQTFPTIADTEVACAHLDAARIPKRLCDTVPVDLKVQWENYLAAQNILAALKAADASVTPDAPDANAPLSGFARFVAFSLPLVAIPGVLVLLAVRSAYRSRGWHRKGSEWLEWFAGGVLFWFLLAAAIVMIHGSKVRKPPPPPLIQISGFELAAPKPAITNR